MGREGGGRGNKSGIPPRGKRGRGNRVEIRRRIVSVVALVKIVGNRTIERRGIIIFLLLQFRFFFFFLFFFFSLSKRLIHGVK